MMQFQCPICKSNVAGSPKEGTSPFFPFCSDRCRLVDLSQWLDGQYRIPVTSDQPEEDQDFPHPADETNE